MAFGGSSSLINLFSNLFIYVCIYAKQALYHLSHISSPFDFGYFGEGISRTICPGWPQTNILLISASQVARIIVMSHQHPASSSLFFGACFLP
jgi:hypothetical protein